MSSNNSPAGSESKVAPWTHTGHWLLLPLLLLPLLSPTVYFQSQTASFVHMTWPVSLRWLAVAELKVTWNSRKQNALNMDFIQTSRKRANQDSDLVLINKSYIALAYYDWKRSYYIKYTIIDGFGKCAKNIIVRCSTSVAVGSAF